MGSNRLWGTEGADAGCRVKPRVNVWYERRKEGKISKADAKSLRVGLQEKGVRIFKTHIL